VSKFFWRNYKQLDDTGQIGISFSPTELAFAYIVNSNQGPFLQHLGHIEAVDEDQRIFLKDQVASLNLQGKQATILLSERDYQIFLIEQPQVPEDERREAIRWRVAEYIDFAIEEAVVDFIQLPQKPNSENAPMLYVIVTKKRNIEQAIAWVSATGLKVKSVDICQSALRQIALHLENAEEGQALLHLENDKSHLILFKEKTLFMMRDLDIGLKMLSSISKNDKSEHLPIYQDLSVEIQRSFDYCASNLQNASVSRLLITPLNEKRPELLSNLSNILGLPVREIQYSEFLQLKEDITFERESARTFAIGAALNQQM
jgi:MSHA biogenesis protein MshI